MSDDQVEGESRVEEKKITPQPNTTLETLVQSSAPQADDKPWQPTLWRFNPINREFSYIPEFLKSNPGGQTSSWAVKVPLVGIGVLGGIGLGLGVNYTLEAGTFAAATGYTGVICGMVLCAAWAFDWMARRDKAQSFQLRQAVEEKWNALKLYFPKANKEDFFPIYAKEKESTSWGASTYLAGVTFATGAVTTGFLVANQFADHVVVSFGYCMLTAVLTAAFLMLSRYADYCHAKHEHDQLARQNEALEKLLSNIGERKDKASLKFNTIEEVVSAKSWLLVGVSLSRGEKYLLVGASEEQARAQDGLEKGEEAGYFDKQLVRQVSEQKTETFKNVKI